MTTLSFQAFWDWLQQHTNCILRAGTPEASLYDDDDLHWYVGPDRGALVVQAIRGKRLMGEIVVEPDRVAYVDDLGEEREGEHTFEAISETRTERLAAYSFVLSHGVDADLEESDHDAAIH